MLRLLDEIPVWQWDKIPKKNNLQEEWFSLGHGLGVLQSIIAARFWSVYDKGSVWQRSLHHGTLGNRESTVGRRGRFIIQKSTINKYICLWIPLFLLVPSIQWLLQIKWVTMLCYQSWLFFLDTSQQRQMITVWIFWNHKSKQIFPPLKLFFFQVFFHLWYKAYNNIINWFSNYKTKL